MSKTTVLKFGWWGRAQKNCLGPIFQQMRMLFDFYCSFTSMVLDIGGGQRSCWEWKTNWPWNWKGTSRSQSEHTEWLGSPESSSTPLPSVLVWRTVWALSLQELAWVACRHHVIELPLPAVFNALGPLEYLILPCSGGSSKPGQVLTIQHMMWLLITCLTVTYREQMVQFCKASSEGLHQRDDYIKNSCKWVWSFLVPKREQGFRFIHQEHPIMHCGWRKSSITSKYLCSISNSL